MRRIRSWRTRLFSYRIHSLIAVTFFTCTCLGVWGVYVRPFQYQRAVADRVRELGGTVKTENGGFAWARRLFGDEAFQHIVELEFHGGDAGDDLVPQLARLSRLRRLVLNDTKVTVAGFRRLDLELPEAIIEFKVSWGAHQDQIRQVAFSPDGKLLAAASHDHSISLWNVENAGSSSRDHSRLDGHESDVYGIGFTPDGKRLVSASHDRTLRLWDLEKGMLEKTLSIKYSVPDEVVGLPVDCSVSGEWAEFVNGRFNFGGGPLVVFQDAEDWPGPTLLYSYGAMAVHPVSRLVAVGGRESVELWDFTTGRKRVTIGVAPEDQDTDMWLIYLALSPTADRLAVARGLKSASTVTVWNPTNGELMYAIAPKSRSFDVWGLAFSPDGRLLATTGDKLDLWNAETGKHLAAWDWSRDVRAGQDRFPWGFPGAYSVAFSPDGLLVAIGTHDGKIHVWSVQGLLGTVVDGRTTANRPLPAHNDDPFSSD